MIRGIDLAVAYYWRIQLIEPEDPDDERYVVLHGEDGEVVGPMTVELAQAWINRFGRRRVQGECA